VEGGSYYHINCRMNSTARVPASGPALVRARFAVEVAPPGLQIRKADLLVKQ
jgi:hypothetical protein